MSTKLSATDSEIFLSDVYKVDERLISYQKNRYKKLGNDFENIFKSHPAKYFSTPGRTEISGNHTDHNHGMVIAASINLDSIAAASMSNNNEVVLYSEGYEKPFVVNLENLNQVDAEAGTTNALIRGIASRFIENGFNVGGFNACITSDVIKGSGLSSSASIEVLIGTIFNHLYNEGKIASEEIAKIGQYAENVFFKKPCGLMDQVACAVGGIISIDFSNPDNLIIDKIKYEFAEQKYSMVMVHTGGSHISLTDDYAAIPKEMKQVASALGKNYCGEINYKEFLFHISLLRNKISDRAILRAYHFIKENERVKSQIAALRKNDFKNFLSLANESGNSSFKYLQNIYSSNDPMYQPVSIALAFTEEFIKQKGEGACRIHGGGFEGTIQIFLNNDFVDEFITYISSISENFKVLNLNIRSTGTTEVIID
jgi:galactokinase